MKLRAINFSTNGQGDLKGTVIAYSDLNESLGVEHTGNYSRDGGNGLLRKLATIGIDQEMAQALLNRLLAQLRSSTDQALALGAPQREHERPVVSVTDRPMRDIVDDSWSLFHTANADSPRFFRFGDVLADIDVVANPIRPRTFTVPTLRHHLDRLGDYTSTRAAGDEHPARPPKDVMESMLSVVTPKLPALTGVVEAPFLEPGGGVVANAGYHPATGLYLSLGRLSVPPVSEQPTSTEMEEARRLLLEEMLGDFPFVHQADRAHAVALIIQPLVRSVIQGPTPLFDIEAPLEGTGKGLLAKVVGYIATGHAPPVRTEGRDDDEWRKRLTSALLETPPVLLLDNVRQKLNSAAMSAVLTAEEWGDRILGQTRDVKVPVRTTWIMTGNNPLYSGEIARRLVRIRLDAGQEHPWERQGFRHPNLTAWVLQERGRLVWAVLTLARAWVAYGKPEGQEVMGSFERWAAVMGGILQVAGVQGFLGNREEVYARVQAEGEAWRTLVDIWWEIYRDQRVGTDQLLALATEHKLLVDLRAGRSERGARTALGMELARLRDRVVGRYQVRDAGQASSGAAQYRLVLRERQEKVMRVMQVMQPPISETTEPKEPKEPFTDPQRNAEGTVTSPADPCVCDPIPGPAVHGEPCPDCGAADLRCPACGGCLWCRTPEARG